MPTIEELRLRSGQVITEDWYDNLCDILSAGLEDGGVDMYGYIHKDLIPDADLKHRLGSDNRRLKEINVGYGNFVYDVTVQGKKVLKDSDPVFIADLYAAARTSVSEAVKSALKPILLAKEIDKNVNAFTDVFASDVPIREDGRLRVQVIVSPSVYAYLKKVPAGEISAVRALLNEGKILPSDVWVEQDITVQREDYVNLQFDAATKVSTFLFNIPSA